MYRICDTLPCVRVRHPLTRTRQAAATRHRSSQFDIEAGWGPDAAPDGASAGGAAAGPSGIPTSTAASDPYYAPHDSDADDGAASYAAGSARRLALDFRPLLSVPLMRSAHPHVRHAATWVDRASVFAGRWLTSRPTLRLGALTYVVVLHLIALTFIMLRSRHCPLVVGPAGAGGVAAAVASQVAGAAAGGGGP